MSNNQNIYQKLFKLKTNQTLPSSQLEKPAYFANILRELIDRKIIKKISPRKGQWSYSVINDKALNSLLEKYNSPPIRDIDKVEATKYFGNAHLATDSKYPSIPIRTTTKGVKLNNIDIYDICKNGLALYLPINDKLNKWNLTGTICLIENQRFFWEAEKVHKADYYLYLQGNFSNKVLEWLISQNKQDNSFLYFGDYDPTGIKLYLRLKQHIPQCNFFIPDNFEELLDKYGNKNDLTKQYRDFNNLLKNEKNKDIAQLRKAFEKTGKTMHQEALLI